MEDAPSAMLDPRQLEAFMAVVRTGSTVAAADVMNLSQPSVSRLIAALERETELKLFERRQGRLVLAPQGRAFHADVEQLYLGTAELRVRAREIAAAAENELRVATIAASALDLVPHALAEARAARPGTRVAVLMRSHYRVIEMVASGRAEIGVVNAVGSADPVRVVGAWSLPCVAVLAADHRLAGRGSLTVDDLATGELVSLGEAFHARGSDDPSLVDDLSRLTGVTANLSLAACRVATAGSGIAIVDPLTAASEGRCERVAVRPFRPVLRYPISLIVRRSEEAAPLDPRVAAFVRAMRDTLRELVPDARAATPDSRTG